MLLFTFLFGFTFIQGIIVSIFLLRNKQSDNENAKYLAGFIGVILLISMQGLIATGGHKANWSWLFFLGTSPFFLIAPMYYISFLSVRNEKRRTLKFLIHLIPFGTVLLLNIMELNHLLTKQMSSMALIIQMLIYTLLVGWPSIIDREGIFSFQKKSLLKILTLIFIGAVFVHILSIVLFEVHLSNIFMIVLLYSCGLITALTYEILITKGIRKTYYYQNSNLKNYDLNELRFVFHKAMDEDMLFKNSSINVENFAQSLNITRHQLTEFMNVELGDNFFEIINTYRLNEAKNLLLREDLNHFSISGIASEAGFKSTSSFYRIFKEKLGMTPMEFKKHTKMNASYSCE